MAPDAAAGAATDSLGRAVLDPTKNVLDLVEAAIRRQDDLRQLDGNWRDKVDAIRAQHAMEIRRAETERIDAIRAVDIGNVQRAAEVQATQALALATQVTALAETVRVQVQAVVAPIQNDIADLRRSQSESVGQKTHVVESQARGGSIGLWIGLAFGVLVFFTSTALSLVGLYLATR